MSRLPLALSAVTALLGAALLFWVELLCGRLLLPSFGGTPAVWTTCLFFFQGALLLGYLHAHALERWATPRVQVALHALLLGLAALALPVSIASGWLPAGDEPPIPRLLGLLAASLGAPFVAVSAGAPLIQSWYSRLGRPDSHDPYPLYAASNLGSLLALAAYPLVIEPGLSLAEQGRAWAAGYALLAACTLGCGAVVWRAPPAPRPLAPEGARPDGRRRARWLLRAFVPACLLYGVTSTITRDMAAVPLLWIVPLALYLLSFVLAFARRQPVPRAVLSAGLPLLLAWMLVTSLVRYPFPVWLDLPLHLLGFFGAAWLLHRDLAAERPAPGFLTGFYLWVATGGLLAGLLCGLLAPLLFTSALEYPLAVTLAALLVPGSDGVETGAATRRLLTALLGLVLAVLAAGFSPRGLAGNLPALLLVLPLALLLALGFSRGRARAALALLLALGVAQCSLGAQRVLLAARSFFGLHRVVEERGFRHYVSGIVVHGRQSLDPARRRVPLAYFHPTGPIGEVVGRWCEGPGAGRRVGAIGLGVGSLAAYARPGQTWRFYEVDPEVEAIARDPRLFTYLADAPGPPEVVLGDGRLSLAREAAAGEPAWDLLVIDAFNSDSVPVHLLTDEAFGVYLERLAEDGLLVLNVSNRYLALDAVVAQVARARSLVGWHREQAVVSAEQKAEGVAPCHCVVLARRADALRSLDLAASGWSPLEPLPPVRLWTDDHADLLGVLRLR